MKTDNHLAWLRNRLYEAIDGRQDEAILIEITAEIDAMQAEIFRQELAKAQVR